MTTISDWIESAISCLDKAYDSLFSLNGATLTRDEEIEKDSAFRFIADAKHELREAQKMLG